MEDKHAEQTPDLRWFSRVVRSLEEGHRVRVRPSLVGLASGVEGGGGQRSQLHVSNSML